MNELRDKITEIVGKEIGWWLSPLVKEEADRPFVADQILALIEEAGYVKLADDQSLPEQLTWCSLDGVAIRGATSVYTIAQWDMLRDGWQKVEICKSP